MEKIQKNRGGGGQEKAGTSIDKRWQECYDINANNRRGMLSIFMIFVPHIVGENHLLLEDEMHKL